MGIKDVIDTVKKPTTLFFDGEYYDSVDELLAACNITRADYTQVKATHRDWDAMNVVDFLVKSNKGVLPSKNPQYKPKSSAGSDEPVINVLDIPVEVKKESAPAEESSDEEYTSPIVEEAEETKEAETVEDASEEAKDEPEAAKEADVAEEKASDAAEEEKAIDAAEEEKAEDATEAKVEEAVEETEEKEVESVEETAEEKTKEEEPTMNEYDYTQSASADKKNEAATPAPSGSTAKAFDELLVNLNIAKDGFLVVKQVESKMSDLDIVNAILTTKGNPIGETSKDFDELLANLNTPKIGFQLVKQIHSDWSDLDVINAIIKSR